MAIDWLVKKVDFFKLRPVGSNGYRWAGNARAGNPSWVPGDGGHGDVIRPVGG